MPWLRGGQPETWMSQSAGTPGLPVGSDAAPALPQRLEAVALLMRCAFPGLPLLVPRAPTHA